jgi:hypothetical protein
MRVAGVADRSGRQGDADDEDGSEENGHDLDAERRCPAGREQDRTDRRACELVEGDEPGLQTGMADTEVALRHEHRHQGPGRGVDEHLRRTDQEQGAEDHADVDDPGDDHGDERDQYDGTEQVRHHDETDAVDAVGDGAGVEAEEQPRQLLEEHCHRDQDRGAGLGCDQQRPGCERNAVAEVGHPAGCQQPPEPRTEPGRRDDVEDEAHGRGRYAAAPSGRHRFPPTAEGMMLQPQAGCISWAASTVKMSAARADISLSFSSLRRRTRDSSSATRLRRRAFSTARRGSRRSLFRCPISALAM